MIEYVHERLYDDLKAILLFQTELAKKIVNKHEVELMRFIVESYLKFRNCAFDYNSLRMKYDLEKQEG